MKLAFYCYNVLIYSVVQQYVFMCVRVYIYVYIYIYICVDVGEWVILCVLCGRRNQRDSYLQRRQIVWKIFLCLFWHEGLTKSWVPVNRHEGTKPEVGGGKDQECWSVKTRTLGQWDSKTQDRSVK